MCSHVTLPDAGAVVTNRARHGCSSAVMWDNVAFTAAVFVTRGLIRNTYFFRRAIATLATTPKGKEGKAVCKSIRCTHPNTAV